jgi:Rv2525c-like, glycoside hydrolase-like domain
MAVREGVDYSFTRPSPTQLRAAGKTFAVRYVGTPGSGKNLTKAEAQALQAAGLDLVSNYEAGNAGWMHGGRTVGVAAAKAAHADAVACGMPPDRPIYFSADWNATLDEYKTQIRPCLQGAADVLGGPGRVGVYGSVYVVTWAMQDNVADWGWGTYAWSFGQWPPHGQLRQYKNGVALAGGIVDLCLAVTADFGQWAGQPEEDLSIVDAETKTYLDNLKTAVLARIDQAVQRVGGRTNSVYNNNNVDYQGLVMAKDIQQLDASAVAALVAGQLEVTGIQTDSAGVVTITFGPRSV